QGRRLLFGYKTKTSTDEKIRRQAQKTDTDQSILSLEVKMDYRLESDIWCAVQRSMPRYAFVVLLSLAVQSYRRRPGYAELERIHVAVVGAEGVEALGEASKRAGLSGWKRGDTFVSIRAHLREHIYGALQQHLISSSLASGAVEDNRMVRDLGL
ncbi:hypothetical protein, partial [Pseudomonas savastanoi]